MRQPGFFASSRPLDRRRFLGLCGGVLAAGRARPARAAAAPLRLGLQESGTGQWEIAAMAALGLPAEYGVALAIRPLADSRAGQVALKTGAVDVILSDFVWVSVERHLGTSLTLVPFSRAAGGLIAPADGIGDVAALAGGTIGIGGGPLDKSWLFFQAYYARVVGRPLIPEVTSRFGAPPLVHELLMRGDLDAALNFWQWNARAVTAGAREVIPVTRMLAELGVPDQPPLLGWTFGEDFAEANPAVLRAFLDASFAARRRLALDDTLWAKLRPLMNVGDNDWLYRALRDGYRAGIVASYDPEAMESAEAAYALLAQYGGADLVGGASVLSPGTFWGGYRT